MQAAEALVRRGVCTGFFEPSLLLCDRRTVVHPVCPQRVQDLCLLLLLKPWANQNVSISLTVHLTETPFYTFENRVDPDQAALVRAA